MTQQRSAKVPVGRRPDGRPSPGRARGWVQGYRVSTHRDGPGTRFTLVLADGSSRSLAGPDPVTGSRPAMRLMNVGQVADELARYYHFIEVAGGGVTVGGGEPLQQVAFTRAVLVTSHDMGLHTVLATTGYQGPRADERLLDATDLVLLDLKPCSPEAYLSLTRTGRGCPTMRFAQRLAARRTPMWIRIPLTPGLTDDERTLEAAARFVAGLGSVERVELLTLPQEGATAKAGRLAEAGQHFARHGLMVG